MPSTVPQTPRDRRRVRARRELATAAVALFEERGFAATTVEDIAAAADYSASTFFRMFTRKEDAVFFDMPDRLEALGAQLGAPSDEPLWPALRAALIDHARTWEEEDPEFAAARVRLFHREPALSSRYLEYCQDYETWIADLVAHHRRTDPQSDVIAQLVAGSVIAGLRSAFRVQAAASGRAAKQSVVVHLERAFEALETGPLRAITA
jgi:AcrR family transcriptional regulator